MQSRMLSLLILSEHFEYTTYPDDASCRTQERGARSTSSGFCPPHRDWVYSHCAIGTRAMANRHTCDMHRHMVPPRTSHLHRIRLTSVVLAAVGLALSTAVTSLSTASATEHGLKTGAIASRHAHKHVSPRLAMQINVSGSLPTSVVVTMKVRACALQLHPTPSILHHAHALCSHAYMHR